MVEQQIKDNDDHANVEPGVFEGVLVKPAFLAYRRLTSRTTQLS